MNLCDILGKGLKIPYQRKKENSGFQGTKKGTENELKLGYLAKG